MSKSKTQKGITLIALIITIIVLLILAVVAIGAVQNDGIINYAKNARDEYEKAQANENEILDSYLVYLNEDLEGEENTGEIKELAEEASIGDFVEYDSGTTYTGKWVISNIDEDGYVYLISATSVESLYLEGRASYASYGSDLNAICDKYLNTDFAEDAYAPKSDDVTNITEYIEVNEEFLIDEYYNYSDIRGGGYMVNFYGVCCCGFERSGWRNSIIYKFRRL